MQRIFQNRSLIVLLLSIVFLFSFYGEAVLHPNNYLFAPDGDGIKNYFTFIHHIKNDVDAHHFNGMNYPFGDMHILTDGHTLISWFLRVIPGSENWAIGFLNLLMLSSFPITAIVSFKLLKEYKLRTSVAIFFALGMMLLAPQYNRMLGHLSMSYSFFIPLTWLWLKRYNDSGNYKYTVYLILFQLALYFTHPYMGVMSLFFIFCFQFFLWIFNHNHRNKSFVGNSLLQILSPLILFQLYVIVLDTVKDRASYKFNFGGYNLDFAGAFFAHGQPFREMYKSLFEYEKNDWEGWGYIGLANLIILLLIFFRFLFSSKKINKIKKGAIIFVGILALIHGAGLFFKHGFAFVLDVVPQIRQIRVLSRFVWIFYFTAFVFTAIYFNKVYIKYLWSRKSKVAVALLVLIGSSFLLESFEYHTTTSKKITKSSNPFLIENLDDQTKKEINNLKQGNYQAILALPFFQVGGDRVGWNISDHKAFYDALVLVYHSNVPLLNTCLSRSSGKQLETISPILTENYTRQPILDSLLNNGKKVALLKGEKALNRVEGRAFTFTSKTNFSDRIYDFDYKQALYNYKDSVMSFFNHNKSKFKQQANLFFEKQDAQVIFENYDPYGNCKELYFRGENAKTGKYNQFTTLIDLKDRLKKKEYTVSFWYYYDMDTTSNIMFFVDETQEGKPGKWTNVSDTRSSYKVVDNWAYLEFDIKLDYPEGNHKLMLKGSSSYFDPPIFVDQLLIREKGVDVYCDYNEELYKNNFPLGKLD